MKFKIDTKSIKFKSWLYFILFAAVLMAALWIVQVLMLNNLYGTMKTAQTQKVAIDIEESGSLAEASVKISGVFEAAQNAAERFLENIRLRQEETDRACEERDSESREKAIELLESTEAKCRALEEETKQKCAEMAEAAKQEADSYWREVSEKMEHFYQEHEGLKEMLDIPGRKTE